MTAPFGRRKVCVALVMLLLLPGSALADKFLVVDALGKQVLSFTPETGLKPFVLPGVLISPRGAAVGPDGNLVVADFATNKVQKFNGRTGKFMKTFAVNAALTGPTGLAFGPGGDLFVATTLTDQVLRFNGTNGTYKGMFTTGGSVTGAMSLVFAPDGTLFVSGEDSNSVEQFDQTGAFMREFVAPGDGGLQRPVALRFDPNGDLEVLGADSMSLGTYDGATGEFLGAVSTMSSSGGFSRGLDGSLFVADAAGVWFMEPGQDQQYPAASAIDPAAMLRLDPDLVVKLFEAPTTQSWDYSMSIKTTVGNVGPVSAPASVVSLYFSRTNSLQGAVGFGCSRTVPVLPPGGASTTSFNCVIPPAWVINLSGPIYILAVADAPGAVVEAFEFNNVKARPFKLGPDLQVTALALTVPGPIVRGTNFTARSTVKNNGGYTATFDEGGALNQIAVELFLSKNATLDATDPSVCWVIMPNMVPLATTDVLSTCGMGAAPGSYYLIVKVDVWDQVHEFNENNNTRALRIDVVDPPPPVTPVANAGPDRDVARSALVTLDGRASGPAGVALSYSWVQREGPDVGGPLTGSLPAFLSPAGVATLVFDLYVSAGTVTSPPDRVQVNVMVDPSSAIFVTPSGNDANAGTRVLPMRTLPEAIGAAKARGTPAIYLSEGTYTSQNTINLANGVSIFGGFQATTWNRNTGAATVVNVLAPLAFWAFGLSSVTEVDRLTITSGSGYFQSLDNFSTLSSYGIRVHQSSGLVLRNNFISAGHGSPGGAGLNRGRPASGVDGGAGANGNIGACDGNTSTGNAAGGFSLDGAHNGGAGGRGRAALSGSEGEPGNPYVGWNFPGPGGLSGSVGQVGSPGGNAPAGAPGSVGAPGHSYLYQSSFATENGGFGGTGSSGAGGGGGGAGGGQTGLFFAGTGNGGGGGGGGGSGGQGGGGGGGGGGSFGVFMYDSWGVVIEGNTIQAGNAGYGGGGDFGGDPGSGGPGGLGAVYCTDEIGAGGNGGWGGPGGRGGTGGGGAGGDSFAIVVSNAWANITSNALSFGVPGAGGNSVGSGVGPSGVAGDIRWP